MWKCLLSAAVEAKAGLSVEDSGLLSHWTLNEETEWDREQHLTNFSSQRIPGQAFFLSTSYPSAASHTGQSDESLRDRHVLWLRPSLLTTSFKHIVVGANPIVPPIALIWGWRCERADWKRSAESEWLQSGGAWLRLFFWRKKWSECAFMAWYRYSPIEWNKQINKISWF